MSPEAQRIAIAEACETVVWIGPIGGDRKAIIGNSTPDYLTDLNAMHGAEKTLNHAEFLKYCDNLHAVMNAHTECHNSPLAWRICASAEIRAEAFLRTIGKWEDDK